MQLEFDLHELAVEDASHGHQRPKVDEYGNSLFVVLQTVDAKGTELQVGEIEIFVGANYILSVRKISERGFQSVRTRCEREPHLLKHGAAFVLYALRQHPKTLLQVNSIAHAAIPGPGLPSPGRR
jgi:magnesium transporter